MRLSDIMGGLDLSLFPQVALVMFIGIFAVAMTNVLGRGRRSEYERAAKLPLEDGSVERSAR